MLLLLLFNYWQFCFVIVVGGPAAAALSVFEKLARAPAWKIARARRIAEAQIISSIAVI